MTEEQLDLLRDKFVVRAGPLQQHRVQQRRSACRRRTDVPEYDARVVGLEGRHLRGDGATEHDAGKGEAV